MAEVFEKYKSFDFSSNKDWNTYKDKEIPKEANLETYKRKWYQKNIDSSFKIDYQEPNAASSSSFPPSQSLVGNSYKSENLYIFENILKGLMFPCSILLDDVLVKIIIAVASLLGIIRNKGMIKFSKEYFLLVISSEFFHNITFTLGMPFERTSIVYYAPIYIQFFSGLCEFFYATPRLFPNAHTNPKFKGGIQFIRENRQNLIGVKCRIEIYLFLYSLLGCFIKGNTFINAFFMYQFITIKDKMMPSMKKAQVEFKESLLLISPNFLKPVTQKLIYCYERFMNMFSFE